MEYFKYLTSFFNWKGCSTDYFNFLPEEITLDILSRLPAQSALDSKLVCTAWRNIISSHQSFSKMHLYHLNHPSSNAAGKGFLALTCRKNFHYFEYTNGVIQRIRRICFTPPFKFYFVIGSLMVCLAQDICLYLTVCIWNPITREYVILQDDIKRDGCFRPTCRTASFGYVSLTNEYKVVGIYASKKTEFIEVHVYTLGSAKGWRNLGKFNPLFRTAHIWHRPGTFANGVLYWLDSKLEMVVAFDLGEEKFCDNISSPPLPQDGDQLISYNRIGVVDGYLFVAIALDDVYYDIWLLRKKNPKEGEEHQGWTKEFRVDGSSLLTIAKRGAVLTCSDGKYINIYDTKNSTSKSLVRFQNGLIKIFPHKNTLVSLKEIGEKDAETVEAVKIEERTFHDYIFKNKRLDEDAIPEYIYIHIPVIFGEFWK